MKIRYGISIHATTCSMSMCVCYNYIRLIQVSIIKKSKRKIPELFKTSKNFKIGRKLAKLQANEDSKVIDFS